MAGECRHRVRRKGISEAQYWMVEFCWCVGRLMKIDPTLEAFFVAIALEHGTHPMPKFGVERNTLAQEITVILFNHKGAPEVLQKVRDTDPQWFYTKLADAYLTWLYEQEESKALLPDVLARMDNDVAERARQAQGMKTRLRVFKI